MTPNIYAFEGVGKTPSHIIGHPDPEIASVLVSKTVIEKLTEVGFQAAIVADSLQEQDRFDIREIPIIEFPDVTVFGYRKVGRTALEVIPPLDEVNLERFNSVIENVFKPRVIIHKPRRITTGEIEQLVRFNDTVAKEAIPAREQHS